MCQTDNIQNSDGIKELQVIFVKDGDETIIWKYISLLDTWSQARVPIEPGIDYKVYSFLMCNNI